MASGYFKHSDCEYFPCHRTDDSEFFNCIFCYCPLFALGENCGGNFTYTEKGIKDCSACLLPHLPTGQEHIAKKLPELAGIARKKD